MLPWIPLGRGGGSWLIVLTRTCPRCCPEVALDPITLSSSCLHSVGHRVENDRPHRRKAVTISPAILALPWEAPANSGKLFRVLQHPKIALEIVGTA